MLTEICQYLRNWFEVTKYFGDFTISEGTIAFSDGSELPLLNNQYFRVVGSVLNDGVHKYADNTDVLVDEVFNGSVWSMAVPPAMVALAGEIANWTVTNTEAINSPYQSESFAGYSYSLKYNGQSSGGAGGATWQSQFASRLAPWRKI